MLASAENQCFDSTRTEAAHYYFRYFAELAAVKLEISTSQLQTVHKLYLRGFNGKNKHFSSLCFHAGKVETSGGIIIQLTSDLFSLVLFSRIEI
jgi:hypothetical protein